MIQVAMAQEEIPELPVEPLSQHSATHLHLTRALIAFTCGPARLITCKGRPAGSHAPRDLPADTLESIPVHAVLTWQAVMAIPGFSP